MHWPPGRRKELVRALLPQRGLPAARSGRTNIPEKAVNRRFSQYLVAGTTGIVPRYDRVAATLPRRVIPCRKGVQGAHYRFRFNCRRIGRIFDFGADLDIDRSQIIEARVVAA
jgi:hypothetical protein